MTVADSCVLMCTTVWLQHPSAASSFLRLCLYMLIWWFLPCTLCSALLCFPCFLAWSLLPLDPTFSIPPSIPFSHSLVSPVSHIFPIQLFVHNTHTYCTVHSSKKHAYCGGEIISLPPFLTQSLSLSWSLLVPLSLSLSLIILLHSQVSWMPTGSSRPGTAGQRERRKEVLERKEEEEKEGVASLGCLRQHPCQSQPQAPPFPLPLPHTPPPWDGGGGSGGRGRWRQWMLQQQYQEWEEHRSFLLPISLFFTLSAIELQKRRLPATEAYPDERLVSLAAAPAQDLSPALDPPNLPWSLYPPRDRF